MRRRRAALAGDRDQAAEQERDDDADDAGDRRACQNEMPKPSDERAVGEPEDARRWRRTTARTARAGVPLRSASAMTLMPLGSIDAAVAVAAGTGSAGTWSVSDTRRWSRSRPQPATYSSVAAVTGGGAGCRVEVASSSRSAAIQTRQAPSMCTPTSTDRQVGEVLHEPDQRPGPSSTASSRRRPAPPAGGAGRTGQQRDADGQPDQQHHQVGVQLGDRGRVEPDPVGGALVAGVRTAAGDHGADHEHRRGDRADRPASQLARRARHSGRRGPSPSRAPQQQATARTTIASDTRKWRATIQG